MALSAANAVQAKTGTVGGAGQQTVDVTLDNPTSGSGDHSVIVEMYGPIVWPGMPDGWEFTCFAIPDAAILWHFYRPNVPPGESSWQWTDPIGARVWAWRVTEWDSVLDPVGAFETYSQNSASGASVATLSTGTTPATNRGEVVALATHLTTHQASAPGMTLNFSGHTGGFVERDEARLSLASQELDASWSWAFGSTAGATYECTATVNTSAADAADSYYALLGVYAATTVPLLNPGGSVVMG
jgi:hypothetical protein